MSDPKDTTGTADAAAAPDAPETTTTEVSPAGAARKPPKPPKPPVKRGPLFAVVALGLGIVSIVLGNLLFKRDAPKGGTPGPPAASPSPSPAAAETKEYRNVEAGITFTYPSDWADLDGDRGPNTIALIGTGRGELLKLDVFALEEPPTTATVASPEVQSRLDEIIGANKTATVTLRELKTINGIDTWHYIAQFTDPDLGVGLHEVYFFFSGVKMEKLLFQAFPISEYNKTYRTIFDSIAASYHTVPRQSSGIPVPTPAPKQ